MKLLTAIVFLIFGFSVRGQATRFSYEYRFIPDSTNISDVKHEMMNLDTSTSGSKFYSYTKYKSDSMMKVNLDRQLTGTGTMNVKPNMERGAVKYSVTKNYPDYQTFLHASILADKYKMAEERPVVWKITSEKKIIGEWKTQKAETDFAGRRWSAWFAADIPIQDGPYKFHGLPGLIVEIEDQTQSHIFTLKAVKKISASEENVLDLNGIEISPKQYNKLLKDYENDPAAGVKKLMMGGMTMVRKDGPGSSLKDQENRLKARIKKDNNRIELSTSL